MWSSTRRTCIPLKEFTDLVFSCPNVGAWHAKPAKTKSWLKRAGIIDFISSFPETKSCKTKNGLSVCTMYTITERFSSTRCSVSIQSKTPSWSGVSTGSFTDGRIKGEASPCTGTLTADWRTVHNIWRLSDPNLLKITWAIPWNIQLGTETSMNWYESRNVNLSKIKCSKKLYMYARSA